MDALVSIVITSYNYGAYIGDAIQSALGQTHRNIEVIVNENASTDNSLEVIKSFTDERLRTIVHLENIGFLPNLNNGIRSALGDFIVILSADDMLLPTVVEDALEQRRLIPEADVIYLTVAMMNAHKRLQYFFDHPALDGAENYWGRNEFASLLARDSYMYFPTTLFPRELFDECGLLDEELGVIVDYEWCIRLAAAGKRFAYLAKPGALINFHGQNLSGVKRFVGSGRQLREFCYVLEKYSAERYHHLIAGYHQELRAMVERKINEIKDIFPKEFAELEPELRPLIERARAAVATVPPIGKAVLRGEGLISVIVPFRGRIAYLQRALESLQAQDYENWEAIVACDSCPDPSSVIEWMGLSDRVRTARMQAARGPGVTRNLGLGNVNGEIVAYLDEDNRFEPGYLRALATAFADPAVNVTAGRSRLAITGSFGDGEAIVDTNFGPLPDGTVSLVSNRLPLNAIAHRRSCLAVVGGFNVGLEVFEDWEFLLRMNRVFPFVRLDRFACTLGIEVTLQGHHVFGRRNSQQWSQYAQRLQDIYNTYPPRSQIEATTRTAHAAALQGIVQRGINGAGNVNEVAGFVVALAGPAVLEQAVVQ